MSMTFTELAESEPDGSLCFSLLREMTDVEVVARFTVEGEPVSKQRPRFSRKNGRVYTPELTREVEKRVGWSFRQAAGPLRLYPADGFGVYIGFFLASGQRRDVDNMTKLILDGLNGIAWLDDSQVTEISAKVARWQGDPRTEVVIYRTPLRRHPSRACQHCGKEFNMYPSAPDRRFCSNACVYQSRGGVGQATCVNCGVVFKIKPSRKFPGKNFCSAECRRADAQSKIVHYSCVVCEKVVSLKPSEAERRPDAKFCSVQCRGKYMTGRPRAPRKAKK